MANSTSVRATGDPDPLSDDSGVDLKPRASGVPYRCTQEASSSKRRNKRKSSEPKKRKSVAKRYRWDTDEDEDAADDFFDVLESERPSSGDSGVQMPPLPDTPEKKKKWKKSEDVPRQSVILKSEAPEEKAGSSGLRPRNYKNMSRQRRIEANARERTRVHTISAAFESLRRAVPAYAHNQKLSKLAILRIASAYIVALACLNGQPDSSNPMARCVEQCTRTIQAEGRSRRRTSKD